LTSSQQVPWSCRVAYCFGHEEQQNDVDNLQLTEQSDQISSTVQRLLQNIDLQAAAKQPLLQEVPNGANG
jgi:hypothetical protein